MNFLCSTNYSFNLNTYKKKRHWKSLIIGITYTTWSELLYFFFYMCMLSTTWEFCLRGYPGALYLIECLQLMSTFFKWFCTFSSECLYVVICWFIRGSVALMNVVFLIEDIWFYFNCFCCCWTIAVSNCKSPQICTSCRFCCEGCINSRFPICVL